MVKAFFRVVTINSQIRGGTFEKNGKKESGTMDA